jgi:hypothetical protein
MPQALGRKIPGAFTLEEFMAMVTGTSYTSGKSLVPDSFVDSKEPTITASSNPGDFQTIRTWSDLTPYAGQIVAVMGRGYFVNDDYINNKEAFSSPENPFIFAYVSSKTTDYFKGGIGYYLNTLYKPDAIEEASIVNGDTIKCLCVRKASTEELKYISKAVTYSLATFGTLFCPEAQTETWAILRKV